MVGLSILLNLVKDGLDVAGSRHRARPGTGVVDQGL